MCILCGDYGDLFNRPLLFVIRSFSIASKLFIGGMCVVAFAPATKTMNGATLHPHVVMLLINNWHFMFSFDKFCGKYIIAVCKFYELYCDLWCRGFWWGLVVWVTKNTKVCWV